MKEAIIKQLPAAIIDIKYESSDPFRLAIELTKMVNAGEVFRVTKPNTLKTYPIYSVTKKLPKNTVWKTFS